MNAAVLRANVVNQRAIAVERLRLEPIVGPTRRALDRHPTVLDLGPRREQRMLQTLALAFCWCSVRSF